MLLGLPGLGLNEVGNRADRLEVGFAAFGVGDFNAKLMLDRNDDFKDVDRVESQPALSQKSLPSDSGPIHMMKVHGLNDDIDYLLDKLVFVHGVDYT